jgi:hypothetical protein
MHFMNDALKSRNDAWSLFFKGRWDFDQKTVNHASSGRRAFAA